MSCKECNHIQNETTATYYFQWGDTSIEVRACGKHLKEVCDALRAAQSLKLWNKQALESQEKL